MKIDCYISQGCGSLEALKDNIVRALDSERIHAEVEIHRISSEQAAELKLSGSPAVFIDGKELQPSGTVGFSWRMFKDESGRLANVPSVETLRKAMKEQTCCTPAGGNDRMKSLMDQIGATVRGRLADANLSQSENETRKYILREFARTGKPPEAKAIAEAMKLPSVEAVHRFIERLHNSDILTIEGGEIVSAYPFSAIRTRHKVAFPDGHEIYSLCATDALGMHFMLQENIVVRSLCPECEGEIKVEMKDGKIASCSPGGVVEFVSSGDHCGCTAKTFCPFMNFFCSTEHLEKWRAKNPASREGEMYQLQQVLEHGKYIFGDFLQ